MLDSILSSTRSRNLCLLAVLAAVGCLTKPKLIDVQGMITFEGQPMSGASIVFHPSSSNAYRYPAIGTAGDDGTYHLMSRGENGVPAGEYIVTVVWPERRPVLSGDEAYELDIEGPDRLGGRYASPKKSDIVMTVTSHQEFLPPIELAGPR